MTTGTRERPGLPSGYALRLASPADAELIQAQREAMFLDMGAAAETLRRTHAASLDWHRRSLADGRYSGWLVEYGGEVVAGAGVLWQDLPPGALSPAPLRAYVLNVYVSPEYRGHALARHLLRGALTECRRRGVSVVTLHASEAGRPTYTALGFRPTDELRLILGDDHDSS